MQGLQSRSNIHLFLVDFYQAPCWLAKPARDIPHLLWVAVQLHLLLLSTKEERAMYMNRRAHTPVRPAAAHDVMVTSAQFIQICDDSSQSQRNWTT